MHKFRNLLRICTLSFLVGGCCTSVVSHAPLTPPPTAEERRHAVVDRLEETTVALVADVEGTKKSFCAGVWVARNVILTAAHCVVDEPLVLQFSTRKDFSSGLSRDAITFAVDVDADLALLITNPSDPIDHPNVTFSRRDLVPSDDLHIVGHTVGFPWTYAAGKIAAVRLNFTGPMDKPGSYVQVSAPVWMGNSGGGAFDQDGNLVGISSWVSTKAPLLAFFIHRDVVAEFLKKNL